MYKILGKIAEYIYYIPEEYSKGHLLQLFLSKAVIKILKRYFVDVWSAIYNATVNISPKSNDVTMCYKQLKMVKIAVFQ